MQLFGSEIGSEFLYGHFQQRQFGFKFPMRTILIIHHNKQPVFKMMTLLRTLVFIKPNNQFRFIGAGIIEGFSKFFWENRGFMVERKPRKIKVFFTIFRFFYRNYVFHFTKNKLNSLRAPEMIPSVGMVLMRLIDLQVQIFLGRLNAPHYIVKTILSVDDICIRDPQIVLLSIPLIRIAMAVFKFNFEV